MYIILLCFFSLLFSQNSCPIILIHGFLGWGRDEMPEYYYWGGKTDLEQLLQDAGHEVYTVSVGPISANIDRAIETFYQIKGGQLDYGIIRSNNLGIIRKPHGKFYEGLYPQWDENNPIHIIGHSQGGQTARMLETLLKSHQNNEESTLLSKIHDGWIKSITTIGTPHNGTTLVPIMMNIFPFAMDLAPWLGGIDIAGINNIYNFDLEHWGVNKTDDESLLTYYQRIGNSPLAESKNLCSWDLSIEGSLEFNKNYQTDLNVYYFSFATSATKKYLRNDFHKPDNFMSLHLRPTSRLMGKYKNVINEQWYENDGICNTISMNGPMGSTILKYEGYPIKGVWQTMNKIKMDHQAIIGHMASKKELKLLIALYNEHARLLSTLK